MRSYGSTTRGGSWSGAHVPLPAAPVVHQRPHITQLAHAADRAPVITLSPEPAQVTIRTGSMAEKHQNAMRLHRSGLYPNAIAREVGVTPRAVRNWIEAAGLTANAAPKGVRRGDGTSKPGPAVGSSNSRRLDQADIDRIVAAYNEGGSATSVSERVGLSHTTVIKYLHLAGVEITRKGRHASRKPAPVEATPKVCVQCGVTFERRPDEKNAGWKARTTCNRTCAARAAYANRSA